MSCTFLYVHSVLFLFLFVIVIFISSFIITLIIIIFSYVLLSCCLFGSELLAKPVHMFPTNQPIDQPTYHASVAARFAVQEGLEIAHLHPLSVLKRCVPKTHAFAFGLRLRSKTRCFKTRVLGRRLPNGKPQERLRFRVLHVKTLAFNKRIVIVFFAI